MDVCLWAHSQATFCGYLPNRNSAQTLKNYAFVFKLNQARKSIYLDYFLLQDPTAEEILAGWPRKGLGPAVRDGGGGSGPQCWEQIPRSCSVA